MHRLAAIWVALSLCLHAVGGEIMHATIDNRWDEASLLASESINARTLTAIVGQFNSTNTEAEEDAPLPPEDDADMDDANEQVFQVRRAVAPKRKAPPSPKRKRPPPPRRHPPPPKRKNPPPKPKRHPPPPPKKKPPPPKAKKSPPPPRKKPPPPPPKRHPPSPKINKSPPPKIRQPPPPKAPPQTNTGERPQAVSRSQMCQTRNLLSRGIVGGRRYGMKYYHACLNRVSKSMDCCEQCRDAEGCQGWFFTRLDCSAFSASSNAGVCYLLSDALLAYEDPETWWNGGVQWTAEQSGWNLGSDWSGGSAVAMETGQETVAFELSY